MIPGPTGTFTYWDWPVLSAGDGFDAFSWTLAPENDPTPDGYFWSHQFWVLGGEAGYAGLQTVGSAPPGKIAIFSIWNAEAAESPEFAAPFTGEGEGFSVRRRWAWEVGEEYKLRVARSGDAAWSAWVDDHLIGTIRVPRRWKGLSETSVMWTERYSGPLGSLADIRMARARFGAPQASAGGRLLMPSGHRNVLARPPGSPGSSIDDVPGGVVQVMGGLSGG